MAPKRKIRVWADGCYDMVHFGHANSFRQAKALGDYLVVGVHSDADIAMHKGPPVFSEEERCALIGAIRWVDEVVQDQPYITTMETLEKFDCDFCCHGDDITVTADGIDTYYLIKAAGRYREIQRTQGVSTTNLVGRILARSQAVSPYRESAAAARSPWTGSELLLTTQRINQFISYQPARPGDTIVYCPGVFDLFHIGHLDFLKKIHQQVKSPHIIVGLYKDQDIARHKPEATLHPIMSVHERLLNLLACKYVAEVIIAAPYIVTKDLIDYLNVDVVVHGNTPIADGPNGDPFQVPKALKKFQTIESGNTTTTDKIIERVIENRNLFVDRNTKKEKQEIELFDLMRINSS